MDKVRNVQEKARVFRGLLEKYAPDDIDALLLLRWLTPLFTAIEKGEIVPPYRYEFRLALGKEADFYDRHKDVYSVQANFVCALEDWESQEWWQMLERERQ